MTEVRPLLTSHIKASDEAREQLESAIQNILEDQNSFDSPEHKTTTEL